MNKDISLHLEEDKVDEAAVKKALKKHKMKLTGDIVKAELPF